MKADRFPMFLWSLSWGQIAFCSRVFTREVLLDQSVNGWIFFFKSRKDLPACRAWPPEEWRGGGERYCTLLPWETWLYHPLHIPAWTDNVCVWGGIKQCLASPLEPTPLKQATSCCHLQHCEKLHRYYISLSIVKIPESWENVYSLLYLVILFACFSWQALFRIVQGDPVRTSV